MTKPTTTHFTLKEGGPWHRWVQHDSAGPVHAIAFSDGSVWDVVNGWRPDGTTHPNYKPPPRAWAYELAHHGDQKNGYSDWRPHLSPTKPNVPEGSIRNLVALYEGELP